MKASMKERTIRSIPPAAERHPEDEVRSQAIRLRARAILKDMPKELKDLCDELAKF
jgi:hypothetical protein